MYTFIVNYKEDGQDKSFSHQVSECFAYLNQMSQNCSVNMSSLECQDVYEEMVSKHWPVVSIQLTDENGKALYTSDHWNCVESVNVAFPTEGASQCTINFAHHNDDGTHFNAR